VAVDPAPQGVTYPKVELKADQYWTSGWEQDLMESYRQAIFEAGYPDAHVSVERAMEPEGAALKQVRLQVRVDSGPKVVMGPVQFEGAEEVQRSVLRRRVALEAGEPLNPLEIDDARRRLGRLRALSRIGVSYDPSTG